MGFWKGSIQRLTAKKNAQEREGSKLDDAGPADSIILATARIHQATLWTQDEHFLGLEGTQYIEKK